MFFLAKKLNICYNIYGKYTENRNNMNIDLFSPKDYQVFQRDSHNMGIIKLEGAVKSKSIPPDFASQNPPPNLRLGGQGVKLWVRIKGTDANGFSLDEDWMPIEIDKDKSFNKTIETPAGGWYELFIKDDLEETFKVDHVGVGEVIMAAGQSNATNSGQFKIKTETGMVSCTDGKEWKLAEDPMLGTHDLTDNIIGCDGGSFYPALGDALYDEFHVPIGIAAVGYGATSVNDWQPDHSPIWWNNDKGCIEDVQTGINLFDFMINRMNELGRKGFRCVLWHQGESDAFHKMPGHRYYELLYNLIVKSQKASGWYVPWFVATVSYIQGEIINYDIRDAQERICKDRIAFSGPDTDTLGKEYRDRTEVHFNDEGLKLHGKMWAECLKSYIHKMTF